MVQFAEYTRLILAVYFSVYFDVMSVFAKGAFFQYVPAQ